MAPHKPASPDRQITIGERNLTIRFSLRAVLALQDLWKLENEEAVHARLKKPENQISDFVDIIWASTRSHHPELTRDEIMDLLDAAGIEGLGKAAQEAILAAIPPDEAKGGKGPRPAAAAKPR